MAKKIALALAAVLLLLASGGYLVLRSLVSDDAVRAQLAARLTEALGQRVTIDRAHLVFSPKIGIELTGVTVGDPTRAKVDGLRLATGLRPLLSRRIEGAEVIVEGGQVDLPLPPIAQAASGPPAAPPSSGGASAGGGMTLVSVDTIALRNFRVTSGDRTLVVDLETTLSADRLEVKRIAARGDGLAIEGTGAVTNLADPRASFDVQASELDLDRIMELLAAFTPKPAAGAARPAPSAGVPPSRTAAIPPIALSLTAPKGRVAGVVFRDLQTRAAVNAGRVRLDPLTFGVFGGRYAGTLTLDASGAVPVFTWAAALEGVDVAQVLQSTRAQGAMTGTLSARVDLKGAGADAAQALASLKGSGRVDVRNGTLPHLDLVGAVVRVVGRPGEAPQGSGGAFSTLGGSFALADGVLTSRDLTMDSRDLDVAGAGTVSLVQGTVDLRANLLLSEDLTRRLGRDAARLTGSTTRMIIPAIVRGPVGEPAVTIDAASMLQKAATEELRNQLRKGLGTLLKKKGGGAAPSAGASDRR